MRADRADKQQSLTDFRCPPPCNGLLGCYLEADGTPYAFEIKCHRHKCRRLDYRGNVIMQEPVEFRCDAVDKKRSEKWEKDIVCNKLLARIVPGTVLEIKCPRCGTLVNSRRLAPNNEEQSNE